jgi:N-acetylglucosamine kinase-like BadF-type ATPase
MILIADSGSTKTDWVTIDEFHNETAYLSQGINPFFVSVDDVYSIVSKTFELASISDKVEKIFFYGTGCIKNHNTNIVLDGIKRFFKNSEIFVEDDMIGAARSMFGNESGIACILGTGANSGKYNGTEFVEKIPTLGYILGDEASGAYFGKILINNYFKKIMPEDLSTKFCNAYNPEVGDVLNKVYKQSFPNRYLAKFTHFLSDNIEHPYVRNLLERGFESFIQNNIAKYDNYKNYPVGFVGSIAFVFSSILKKTCESSGLMVKHIIEKPIKGLIQFHAINN